MLAYRLDDRPTIVSGKSTASLGAAQQSFSYQSLSASSTSVFSFSKLQIPFAGQPLLLERLEELLAKSGRYAKLLQHQVEK